MLCEWLAYQPGVMVFFESRILVSMHVFIEEMCRFQNLNRDSAKILSLARRLILDYYCNSSVLVRKRILIDKEPLEPIAFPSKDYAKFIGNFKRLFPESKLLLTIRDPIATIWSMTNRTWGESLTNMEAKRFTIEEHKENWSSCADLILQYCSDPNTYIAQFGRLVNESEKESRRILDFLGIQKANPFQPRQTKEIGFTNQQQEEILCKVQYQLELLKAKGITDLK
jgi:hypothetical protein